MTLFAKNATKAIDAAFAKEAMLATQATFAKKSKKADSANGAHIALEREISVPMDFECKRKPDGKFDQ